MMGLGNHSKCQAVLKSKYVTEKKREPDKKLYQLNEPLYVPNITTAIYF